MLRTNDIAGIKKLLASGYDVESKDQYGRTLLENAAMHGQFEIARLLYQSGAKLSYALEYAVNKKDAEAIAWMEEAMKKKQ